MAIGVALQRARRLLTRAVGPHKAKELALFADIIDAKEAERMGLVNRVVPAADLDDVVADWASRLAAGPPPLKATATPLSERRMSSSRRCLASSSDERSGGAVYRQIGVV